MRINNEPDSVAEFSVPPRQERWDRAFAAPPRQRLSFGGCHRSTLHATQQVLLDRLIEQCPGPWAPGQLLPLEAKVWCATYEGEVVGYMAYTVPNLSETAWLLDLVTGCPTISILRVAVLPRWRRKGAGHEMVNMVKAICTSFLELDEFEIGRPLIRSVARVPRSCTTGRRFFRALGYQVASGGDSDSDCLERISAVALDDYPRWS